MGSETPIIEPVKSSEHPPLQNMPELNLNSKRQRSMETDRVIFLPVRPNFNNYDKIYFSENLQGYKEKAAEINSDEYGSVFCHDVVESIIQDCDDLIKNLSQGRKVIYMSTDSFWYFPDWTPPVEGVVYISGGLFSPVPTVCSDLPG